MAEKKVSQLNAIAAVTDDDLIYIVDDPTGSPAGKKGTFTQVYNWMWGLLSGAANKAIPVGADSVTIVDSEDSDAAKTVTFSDFGTAMGLGTISTQDASAVAITGGAIDGATVGATSATTGAFTTLTAASLSATTASILGGTINGAVIGGTSATTGTFGYLNTSKLTHTVEPWDDIVIAASALGAGASAPNLVSFLGAGNLKILSFDGGATMEQLYGSFEMLHTWKEGTTISPHVHWSPTTADAGDVKWQLEYSISNQAGTFPAVTPISGTGAAGGTAWTHNFTAFTDITMSGITIGAIVNFRLFRDPGDGADTYAANAGLSSFGVHFQKDTAGSASRTTK